MNITISEATIRLELGDPSFEKATVRLDFETDRYCLCFSSGDLLGSTNTSSHVSNVLATSRGEVRRFKTIDLANKIAERIGYSVVTIDNQRDLFK